MTAVVRDLSIEQGATFRLSFTWSTSAGVDGSGVPIAGTPYDLTDCTARMQIRKSYTSPALVSLASGDGITLGGPAGTVEITVSDERTDALNVKTALYDLEIEFPSGDVYRVLEGAVTVSPNVTKDAP